MALAPLRRALYPPRANLVASLSPSTLSYEPFRTPLRANVVFSRSLVNQTVSCPTPIVRPHASSVLGLRSSPSSSLTTGSFWRFSSPNARQFSASHAAKKDANTTAKPAKPDQDEKLPASDPSKSETSDMFATTEKASRAAQMNYRARLSKEGKESKKPASMNELWRLLKIASPETLPLSVAVILLCVSSAITMSIPWLVGKIMNLAGTTSFEDTKIFGLGLYPFFGCFAMFLSVGALANYGRIVLLRIIGERVVSRLRSQLFRKTMNQDAEFFDANRVGDLISRLGSDTIIVGKSITQNVSDGLRSLIGGIAGLVMMTYISPTLVLNMIFAGPFIGAGAWFYSRIIRRLSREMQKNLGDLSKIGEERLGNVRTSQAFVGEAQEVGRYNKQVKRIFEVGKKTSYIDAAYFAGNTWMGNMIIIGLLWSGGNLVREGILDLGSLTSFMMYSVWAGSSIFGVTGFLSELTKGAGAASRLFEIQDREPNISSTKGMKVKSAQGAIKFDNVSFSYPLRPAVSIFNGLSFEIPTGSNVCIVGPSGGGKSTVTSLLLRFYDLNEGSISIGGAEISKMNAKSLRRRIGVVPQEPVLFSGTIAENIAYGKPNATRAEIMMAASRANCDFIKDQPKGFDTKVGPRGSQISGGQKQRVALARAVLKNPDILILDEATSALDAKSETAVNAALANLMNGGITTISIAHRLSTIKRSDQIIVLHKDGYTAEVGSYSELSANPNSEFSKLMEWQLHGGEAPPPVHANKPPFPDEELAEEEHDELDGEQDGQEEEAREEVKSRT
ncbi:ABC transporter [Xylariaceae sp. FL0016]|nr:ABC transporter [Xylariaceae sp. FL0016]